MSSGSEPGHGHRARRWSAAVVALALLLAADVARALDPGTARGTLTRNGESIELHHAQVFRFRDLAGLAEHAGRTAETRILLSEAPFPPGLLAEVDLKRLERHAQRGQLRSVLVTAPLTAEGTLDGSLMVLPAPAGIPLYSIHEVRGLELTQRDHRVGGRITFDGARADFAVSATFDAPEFVETPPLENRSDDAARDSAPARAALEFEQRLKAGDFDGARAYASGDLLPQLVDLERRAADPIFAEQFMARLPSLDACRAQIVQMVRYADRAYLVIRNRTTSLTTLRHVQGTWRVDD